MRSMARLLALFPLLLLAIALPAHADPMDSFTLTGGGAAIGFSLPASTTEPCCSYNGQFNFGLVTGTVNGVSQTIDVNFITGSGCAVCDAILVGYDSTSWAIGIPPGSETTSVNGMDVTLAFVPGDYMTDTVATPFTSFEVAVTPAAAATPEPATIFSLITAAMGLPLLTRRRAITR